MNIYHFVKDVFLKIGRLGKNKHKCFMFALFDWNIYLMQFAKKETTSKNRNSKKETFSLMEGKQNCPQVNLSLFWYTKNAQHHDDK